MSNFYISSVDIVTRGTTNVHIEGDHWEEVIYDEKDENKPINMDRVTSFQKAHHKHGVTSNLSVAVEYPQIIFRNENQKDIAWWNYPPTDEGRQWRDQDYESLKAAVARRL